MSSVVHSPAGAVQDRPRKATKGTASPRRARSQPIEKTLPPEVIRDLAHVARSNKEITPKLLASLDQRWELTQRHKVSPLRLRNYLRRLRSNPSSIVKESSGEVDKASSSSWPQKLVAHRQRQALVAKILDATFGSLADCSPDDWDRRAYLMLVGLVYERLATAEDEVPTAELVSLAKVLAAGRRIEVRAAGAKRSTEPNEAACDTPDALPDSFGEMVRRVYGTNFQQAGRTEPDASVSGAEGLRSDGVGG